MLHLFNKVYLELDDKIELNLDRVVIGRQGHAMAKNLTGLIQGELLLYSLTFPTDFVDLIETIKTHTDTTGKKLIVYTDLKNYRKFVVKWFKIILPNLDKTTFDKLIELTEFKERVTSNTQLQAVSSVKMEERRVGKECRSRWSPYH